MQRGEDDRVSHQIWWLAIIVCFKVAGQHYCKNYGEFLTPYLQAKHQRDEGIGRYVSMGADEGVLSTHVRTYVQIAVRELSAKFSQL